MFCQMILIIFITCDLNFRLKIKLFSMHILKLKCSYTEIKSIGVNAGSKLINLNNFFLYVSHLQLILVNKKLRPGKIRDPENFLKILKNRNIVVIMNWVEFVEYKASEVFSPWLSFEVLSPCVQKWDTVTEIFVGLFF